MRNWLLRPPRAGRLPLIPLVRSTLRSGASRSLYLDFLAEAYHHVKHTFPCWPWPPHALRTCAIQDALVEYMEEERGHEQWILNDIRALGGDPDMVREGQGGPACRIMVGYAYYAIEHISPYAFLGSMHVLEGMSVLLADNGRRCNEGISRLGERNLDLAIFELRIAG